MGQNRRGSSSTNRREVPAERQLLHEKRRHSWGSTGTPEGGREYGGKRDERNVRKKETKKGRGSSCKTEDGGTGVRGDRKQHIEWGGFLTEDILNPLAENQKRPEL